MNKKAVQKVTHEVISQFPEMDGVKPAVKTEKGMDDRYVVTYRGSAELPGGKTMKRIVRVVADGNGDVIKMSTSR